MTNLIVLDICQEKSSIISFLFQSYFQLKNTTNDLSKIEQNK